MLPMYAALAKKERAMISACTKAALASKVGMRVLGNRTKWACRSPRPRRIYPSSREFCPSLHHQWHARSAHTRDRLDPDTYLLSPSTKPDSKICRISFSCDPANGALEAHPVGTTRPPQLGCQQNNLFQNVQNPNKAYSVKSIDISFKRSFDFMLPILSNDHSVRF